MTGSAPRPHEWRGSSPQARQDLYSEGGQTPGGKAEVTEVHSVWGGGCLGRWNNTSKEREVRTIEQGKLGAGSCN